MAVTAALAATAYGGSKAAANSKIVIDGTTGTVVNIDPANEYDYDSFTVDLPIFQGLYGFPSGAKLKPVLATGCSHNSDKTFPGRSEIPKGTPTWLVKQAHFMATKSLRDPHPQRVRIRLGRV
jgi:hypothetical protein